jgi:hypothetical protein
MNPAVSWTCELEHRHIDRRPLCMCFVRSHMFRPLAYVSSTCTFLVRSSTDRASHCQEVKPGRELKPRSRSSRNVEVLPNEVCTGETGQGFQLTLPRLASKVTSKLSSLSLSPIEIILMLLIPRQQRLLTLLSPKLV